jgi:hypothetical protein
VPLQKQDKATESIGGEIRACGVDSTCIPLLRAEEHAQSKLRRPPASGQGVDVQNFKNIAAFQLCLPFPVSELVNTIVNQLEHKESVWVVSIFFFAVSVLSAF